MLSIQNLHQNLRKNDKYSRFNSTQVKLSQVHQSTVLDA